jgi:hypothetical protein
MTDLARKIEADRRRKEDELLLLLLLAWEDAQDHVAVMLQYRSDYQRVLRATANDIAPLIASSMATMHVAAQRRFARLNGESFGIVTPDEYAALVLLYDAQAQASADAQATSLSRAVQDITAKFPDETPLILARSAFENAGYSRRDSSALDLGTERAIVYASNLGMIDSARRVVDAEGQGGAFLPTDTQASIGLRHYSVIDDRTTEICLDRHQLTLPANHPYWRLNVPPLHHHCRSIVLPVFGRYEASEVLPSVPVMPGWGAMPPGFLSDFALAA